MQCGQTTQPPTKVPSGLEGRPTLEGRHTLAARPRHYRLQHNTEADDGDEPEVVSLEGANYKPQATSDAHRGGGDREGRDSKQLEQPATKAQQPMPEEQGDADDVVPPDFVWQHYVRMYPDLAHANVGACQALASQRQ